MKDRNENREGYKLTKLGWIPKHWEIYKGKEITEKITKGASPKWQGYAYQESGILFITSENVREGYLDISRPKYLSEDFNKKQKNSILKYGDILINIVGASIGRACMYDEYIKANTNQAVAILRVNSNVNKNYVSQYLNLQLTVNRLLGIQSDGARPNLTLYDLNTFQFVLPTNAEQNIIVKCLSTWDRAIQSLTQLIEQKKLRKKWLMQVLLTGKKRLPGFDKDFKRVGSGEVFESISIKGFFNEELLSVTQDKGVIPRSLLELRVTMPSGELDSFKLVEKGNFVISLRSFQGGLEYSYYRGVVSPAYTVIKPKSKINDEYYKQYFKSYDFVGHLAIAVIGIRDGKQISFGDFCTVKIPFPSFQEQSTIASVLITADKEIEMLNQKLCLLKDQKKGLMQQLLTGRKKLKIL